MRCLDWDDETTAEFAIRTLSKAWKIKFHRVPALAILVAGLVEHQESVGDGFGVNYPSADSDVLYEEEEQEEVDDEADRSNVRLTENEKDEEFLQELEKMVSDNVQDRLKETVRPAKEIVVPMMGKTHRSNDEQKFVMLVRKGNKTLCKDLAVMDSDLVRNLKEREEKERQEKEKFKKLTLDIQRMQLEDSQDGGAGESGSPSQNTNHQRRARYSAQRATNFGYPY
ncbi:unnamed protein product [Nesidiocoris tenuis]|uniref:Up-frameshift suppressor 2 C-terminal domain-containing protein n=1 Tax=Nesidiocoris tenuis TaxID=355587 RepID=A0A6H5GUI2_9HEMI|nr:unnamed protein product [Nesidiocoris tenuis]